MNKVDLSKYENSLSRGNQLKRLLWSITWWVFAKPLPRSIGSGWKRFLLRAFGAKIHKTAIVYSTARVYMPWNLEMDALSVLASEVDCYNVDKVILKSQATVSQKTYLCTASHDISKSHMPLITAPIIIEDQAWIGADSFIGMGVIVGQGAVIGARSAIFKNIQPWKVVGGNPAKFLKERIIILKT